MRAGGGLERRLLPRLDRVEAGGELDDAAAALRDVADLLGRELRRRRVLAVRAAVDALVEPGGGDHVHPGVRRQRPDGREVATVVDRGHLDDRPAAGRGERQHVLRDGAGAVEEEIGVARGELRRRVRDEVLVRVHEPRLGDRDVAAQRPHHGAAHRITPRAASRSRSAPASTPVASSPACGRERRGGARGLAHRHALAHRARGRVGVVGRREAAARHQEVVDVHRAQAAEGDAVGLPGRPAVRADVLPDRRGRRPRGPRPGRRSGRSRRGSRGPRARPRAVSTWRPRSRRVSRTPIHTELPSRYASLVPGDAVDEEADVLLHLPAALLLGVRSAATGPSHRRRATRVRFVCTTPSRTVRCEEPSRRGSA